MGGVEKLNLVDALPFSSIIISTISELYPQLTGHLRVTFGTTSPLLLIIAH